MSQSKALTSQSKSLTAGKGASKSKAKPAGAKRKSGDDELVTVRVIPAPDPVPTPAVQLNPAEKARSAKAIALAADIEQALRDGGERAVTLDPEAVQALLGVLCKVFSVHSENGERYDAFSQKHPVTPTDVMVTASGLLKAANLAVFELGMWQSWTGR